MPTSKWKNPFYTLLIPAGFLFCLTAFAYGWRAFWLVNHRFGDRSQHGDHPLFEWLDQHAATAILIELAVLAVLTVGAITTDHFWTRSSDASDNLPGSE